MTNAKENGDYWSGQESFVYVSPYFVAGTPEDNSGQLILNLFCV